MICFPSSSEVVSKLQLLDTIKRTETVEYPRTVLEQKGGYSKAFTAATSIRNMIAKLQARNQQLQSPSSSSQLNPFEETPLLFYFATLQRNKFRKMKMYKISHTREQSCKMSSFLKA